MSEIRSGKPYIPFISEVGITVTEFNEWVEQNNQRLDAMDDQIDFAKLDVGIFTNPEWSWDSANSQLIISPPASFIIHNTADFTGERFLVELQEPVVLDIPTPNQTYVICSELNNGTFTITASVGTPDFVESNRICLGLMIRTPVGAANIPHMVQRDTLARGMPNRSEFISRIVQRFRAVTPVTMDVYNNTLLTTTAGKYAVGAALKDVASVDTGTTNFFWIYKDSPSTWAEVEFRSNLNTTQYQNPQGGLLNVSNNRFAINDVWRGVEEQLHIYITPGTGNFNQVAQYNDLSNRLQPPSWVSEHATYLGRIVYEVGGQLDPVVIIKANGTVTGLNAVSHPDLVNRNLANQHTASSITDTDRDQSVQTSLNTLYNTYLQDAPSDGNAYVRKDGQWVILNSDFGTIDDN